MRIFTVVCRREDTPDTKYVRFLLETDRDYRLNSKKLHALSIQRHADMMERGTLPPSHVVWIDTGAHEALAPQNLRRF